MIFEFLNHEQILPHLRETQKSAISPIVNHLIETIADVGWAPDALLDGLLDALPNSEWGQHEQAKILHKHLQAALNEIRLLQDRRRFDASQLYLIQQNYEDMPKKFWPPELLNRPEQSD